MSHFLDRLNHFSNPKESFSGDHGVATGEDRSWEDAYRDRWAHDKIVRSTHGVNCTGSCSWKIYVKGGIVTWETSRPTTRARAGTCPTTNRAAVRAVPATAGTCTAPTA
jgi:nitrate reductase alpha subunit